MSSQFPNEQPAGQNGQARPQHGIGRGMMSSGVAKKLMLMAAVGAGGWYMYKSYQNEEIRREELQLKQQQGELHDMEYN